MPIGRRTRIGACVLGGFLTAITPSNWIAYETAYSALHGGFTKEQIDAKFDQLSFGSDFLVQHPYAAGSAVFYYVKAWPGKTLAYIRHDLEK
ncbi:MAG: hypothetical protein HY517_02025 [Candidatus Aenigmarchaeota archaeon]|nr:hypothetical protein [Candidatus Aenigmarchaeota archaeon]